MGLPDTTRRKSPSPPTTLDHIHSDNEEDDEKKTDLVRLNFALWCSQVRQDMEAYDSLMRQAYNNPKDVDTSTNSSSTGRRRLGVVVESPPAASGSESRSRRRLHSDPLLPLISPTLK